MERRYQFPWTWPVPLLFGAVLLASFTLLWTGITGERLALLGIPPRLAAMMLLASLVGAAMNVPLVALRGEPRTLPRVIWSLGLPYLVQGVEEGRTVLAVNLGGAAVPLMLSLRFLARTGWPWQMLAATGAVAAAGFLLARPVPGVGIVIPFFVPPLVAAGAAFLLGGREGAAPILYVAGSLGTLAAHLLRLKDLPRLGSTMVSVGGAGAVEGILLSGALAAVLA